MSKKKDQSSTPIRCVIMSNESSSAQPTSNDSSAPPNHSNNVTTPRTMSSFHSFQRTTQILQSANGVSIHSSSTLLRGSSNVGVATNNGGGGSAPDDEILSIQTSIEQVINTSQGAGPRTPSHIGTRATFHSIRDALGNLRSRLHHVSSQTRNNSMIQRLQERLNAFDAAHSSRVPLHVFESRRGLVSDAEAEESKTNEEGLASMYLSAPTLNVSSATVFHINTSATVMVDTATYQATNDGIRVAPDGRTSDNRPTVTRRSSLLFASRTVANNSMRERTSVLLLASGDISSLSFHRSSSRNLEMHMHPSIRTLSPVADVSRNESNETSNTTDKDNEMIELEQRTEDEVIDVKKNLFHSENESLPADSKKLKHDPIIVTSVQGGIKMAQPTQEDDVSEVEPMHVDESALSTFEPSDKDSGDILYSWGRGEQSLHDDSDDRIPLANGDEKETIEIIRVSSRLQTKSIIAVATGTNHSACVSSQGTLYVVGNNVNGCVDPDSPAGEVISRPVLLDCISHIRVLQVSCGLDHTAALSSTGSVLTWGSNLHGQLGRRINRTQSKGDVQCLTSCKPMAMVLGQGRRATAIACGTNYTIALTEHFAVLACGIASIAGYRDEENWGMPQELPSLIGFPIVGISAGDGHASVVTAHGTAYVWGENRNGCCGRDFPETMSLPVPLKESSPPSHSDDFAVVKVACGLEHTVLVTRSGHLFVCGSNYRGQLGIAVSELQSTSAVLLVRHPRGGTFVSAEAGNSHSVLLDTAGDLWVTNSVGMKRILQGKSVLTMAAGGDNCIVKTSAGVKSFQRQFSVSMEFPENRRSLVDDANTMLDEIELLSDNTTKEHAEQQIAQKFEDLLRYPSLLNFILNPMKLEQLFERFLITSDSKAKQNMANAIERGMRVGLDSLQRSRMIYPEAVRCLLNVIKFFDIRRDESVTFDVRGEAISLFCDTILSVPFEGYNALHDLAIDYPKNIFYSMLVRPLLLSLNSCSKFTIDENQVEHVDPSRRSVPVIVAVLSWLHAMSMEVGLSDPKDFYSDGVSKINVQTLFEDLTRMKKASPHERSRNFYICAHPFLLSPGCKRDLLQMESQVEMFKAMMGNVEFSASTHHFRVDPFFPMEIEREHLLTQTLEVIKQADPKDIRKRLRVTFKGEPGLDAGGVTKEFFQLLSEELFDVETSGMWSKKYGEDINWFNPDNTWDDYKYEIVGVLFGLAVYNSVLLNVNFPLAVYRKILGLPLGLEDIMDDELRRGLKQLLDYNGDDVEDIFCLTFELTWIDMGEKRRVELKTDGANIPVTKDNKEEYVLRYVRWVLVDSIHVQWEHFQTGLLRVMEYSSLDLFSPEELELLVVGIPELDFDALEKNTKYEGGYDESTQVVRNFWKFVKEASPDDQSKLLMFVTSSTKAPIGGLGKMNFIIQKAGTDSVNLPTSHTCFNTLLLPDYGDDYNKLTSLLGRAILECEGFGLE